MDEYVLVLRLPEDEVIIKPEQREQKLAQWDQWFAAIEKKGRLVPSKRLGPDGTVMTGNEMQTDGPFVEVKEQIIGFVVVLAESMSDACELAKNCPVFSLDGSVEVRPVIFQRS
jgi:hypothetical protein